MTLVSFSMVNSPRSLKAMRGLQGPRIRQAKDAVIGNLGNNRAMLTPNSGYINHTEVVFTCADSADDDAHYAMLEIHSKSVIRQVVRSAISDDTRRQSDNECCCARNVHWSSLNE